MGTNKLVHTSKYYQILKILKYDRSGIRFRLVDFPKILFYLSVKIDLCGLQNPKHKFKSISMCFK